MKKTIKLFLLIAGLLFIFVIPVLGDQPPDPGGGPGTGGNPVGGGAPLDGGMITLFLAGFMYGINKIRNFIREN